MAEQDDNDQVTKLKHENDEIKKEIQLANLMLADLSIQLTQTKVAMARESALLKLANQPTA